MKVYPSLEEHSLPELLSHGLYVTINSDDPPMFNTTLTGEYLAGHRTFGWDLDMIRKLVVNALKATLLPESEKMEMLRSFSTEFDHLK